MSAKIDEKVVEMRFDNKQFEKNVHTSISTLDRLKSAVNFKHAGNSFRKLNAESKKCDMSTLSKAADAVKVKFSAMEVAGVTAMTRITNAVMNTGKQMIKSLTIDPIKGGFSTYELKTNSVQTIMASTGESIETVTEAIKELNTYSDKTIYHFSDMMSNIGKFTNAGVSLEDAKQAMIGISNEAARSGANAMEASRAMYNLAQSMSMGYVQYIDWKSIENANMATKEFKTQLIETAVAMGTMTKAADGYTTAAGHTYSLQQSFKDGMKDQWLTTDVLVKTLGNYADVTTDIGKKSYAAATEIKTFTQLMDVMKESAATGWSTTWELLFGNLIEAKKLWTSVNKVIGGYIGQMAEVRNETLSDWKAMGGRQSLIDALANSFNALVRVLEPVHEAFRQIFPRKTAEEIFDLTERFKAFTKQLRISDEAVEKIKNTSEGFFKIFKSFGHIFALIGKALKPFGAVLEKIGSGTLDLMETIGKALSNVSDSIIQSDKLENLVSKFSNSIQSMIESVKTSGDMRKVFDAIVTKAGEFKVSIITIFETVRTKFLALMDNIVSMATWGIILNFIRNVVKVLKKIPIALAVFGKTWADFTAKIASAMTSLIKPFTALASLIDNLQTLIPNVRKVLKAVARNENSKAILNMALSVLVLAGAVALLTLVDQKKLIGAIAAVAALTVIVGILGNACSKMTNIGSAFKTAAILSALSISVLLMAVAFNKINDYPFHEFIIKALEIATLVGILSGVMIAFNKLKVTGSLKAAMTILALAGTVLLVIRIFNLLISDVQKIKQINSEDVGDAFGVMTLILASFAGMLVAAKHVTIGSAFALIAAIVSIKIIVSLLVSLANTINDIDPVGLLKSVILVGLVVVAITVILGKIGKADKDAVKATASLLLMSMALLLMVPALKAMAKMSADGTIEEARSTLLKILGLFALLIFVSKFAGENAAKAGVMILMTSVAIMMLSAAIAMMSFIKPEKIIAPTLAIMGIIGMFALLVKASGVIKGGRVELMVMTIAVSILVGVMLVLTFIDPSKLIAPTLAMMGLIGIFALAIVASKGATKALGGILAMSLVIAVIGASLYILAGIPNPESILSIALGIGIVLGVLSVSCAILSVVGAVAPAALKGVLVLMALIFALQSLFVGISLLETYIDPHMAERIDRGIELVSKIAYGLGRIVGSIGEGVADSLPHIGEQFGKFFDSLKGIDPNISPSLKTLAEAVLIITGEGILDALTSFIPGKNNGLVSFVTDLCAIAEPLTTYSAKVKNVDAGSVAKSATAISELSNVSDVISKNDYKINRVIQMKSFLDNLNPVIEAAAEYSKNVVDIDNEAIHNSIESLKAIVELSKSMKGVKSLDGNNLSTFVVELESVAEPLSKFSNGVKNINVEALSTSTSALDGLVEIGKSISEFKYDGDVITGKNGLGSFINDLNPLSYLMVGLSKRAENISATSIDDMAKSITSLVSVSNLEIKDNKQNLTDLVQNLNSISKPLSLYSENVKGINFEAIDKSSASLESLNSVATKVSESNYNREKIVGESGIGAFISMLAPLTDDLRSLGQNSQSISTDGIDKVVSAMTGISDISQLTFEDSGDKIVKLIEKMNSITNPLQEYSNAVANIKTDKITDSVGILTSLNDIANAISSSEYDMTKISGDSSINSFITSFTPFVDTINAFSEKAKSIETASLDTAVANITKVANLGTIIPDSSAIANIASFGTELGNLATSLLSYTTTMSGVTSESIGTATANFESIVDSLSASMEAFGNEFTTYGLNMMQNLSTGINDNAGLPTDSVDTIIETIGTTLDGVSDDAYTAGKYFAEGFATGITEFAVLASDAASVMAQGAVTATTTVLNEHSPSKVAFGIGKFYSMGAANGIKKYSNLVSIESANLGEMAITGLQNAVSKIQSFIDTDMDTQPVIRPIVDISGAKRDVRALSNMLNKQQAARISTDIAKSNAYQSGINTMPGSGHNVVFNQYNSSPKALSRTEIYRHTKNQLSAARGLVKS